MQEDNENLEEFFSDVAEKINGIKALVKKYGLEDVFTMSYIGGVYRVAEDGSVRLATQVDFVVTDEEELDELLSVQVDLYRMTDGMTADQTAAMPTSLDDTEGWTDEDWMNFINKNTNGNN